MDQAEDRQKNREANMRDAVQTYQEWKTIYSHLFEEGDDGLPIPGQVIKYFREVFHLTTEELALILRVTKRRDELYQSIWQTGGCKYACRYAL